MAALLNEIDNVCVTLSGSNEQRRHIVAALRKIAAHLDRHDAQIAALAPESAPPVPVTAPPTEPTTPSMTAEQFYAELDALEETAGDPRRMPPSVALIMAVGLGARWRAATGLPLPVRPR